MTAHVPITVERCPLWYTGAAVSMRGLAMVSVERANDRFVIVRDKSAQFVLQGAGQGALRRFHRELRRFLEECSITDVILRTGPARGSRQTHVDVSRMRAALELVPGVSVTEVNYLSLRPFALELKKELPPPLGTLPYPFVDIHEQAIAAACLSHEVQNERLKIVERCIRPEVAKIVEK